MKAFWFAFNPGDWLSDKRVRLMSLAERGAYIGLLALSWGEEQPGTLPAEEDMVRRMAEISPADWVVSGPAILAVFPLSECGTYRYNKRLLKEVSKREALSEKKAEAGRKSAELKAARKEEADRLATERQQNVNTNATPVEIPATGVAKKANQLQSQLQLQAKAEEVAAAPSPGAPRQVLHPAALKAETDGADTFSFAESFFTKPEVYAAVLRDIGFSEVDALHYFREIAADAKDKDSRLTMPAWRKRLTTWLKNDKSKGCLLLATGNGARPASPDPEADRIRAFAHTQQQQPVSQWKGYQSGPNKPASTSPAGQHTSTIR